MKLFLKIPVPNAIDFEKDETFFEDPGAQCHREKIIERLYAQEKPRTIVYHSGSWGKQ
ncbi:MAG: hypothetical protein JRJ09_15775 [Deltaproteobacteria bacterium]|nr:hypothetical protein [Deltaproteobacteria bacterium]